MKLYELKRIYESESREAALEACKAVLAENPESGEELAFLAADFAHAEALEFLFAAGVSPAITDKYGFTLLHYLARQQESTYNIKKEGAVKAAAGILLDNKVSALRKDENESMTCYHYAARNGMAELVEVLAGRGVKLNITDKEGNTGIHIACDYVKHALSDIEYKKKDLERAEKQNNEAEKAREKYNAAVSKAEGYFRAVKTFAEGGVDKDEKNEYGKSALDFAVANNAKKIAAFLSGAQTEGPDVAAGGMTLHQAAEKGDVEAINAIAGSGADLNALLDAEPHKNGGLSPLSIAVLHLQNKAVEALLACGADPCFKDANGRTALSFLHRASVNGKAFEEKRIAKIIKDMIGAGLKIDMSIDDDGNTLLILACKSSRGDGYNRYTRKGEIIDAALKYNPDINARNRFGETALMHACARDFETMENVQLSLLEQGADVSAADQNGNTALHYAAGNDSNTGAKTLCDMLLDFGAGAGAVNNAKKTALDIATEKNNEPLVKLLLSRM